MLTRISCERCKIGPIWTDEAEQMNGITNARRPLTRSISSDSVTFTTPAFGYLHDHSSGESRLGIQFQRARRHSRCNLSRKAAIIASSAEQKM